MWMEGVQAAMTRNLEPNQWRSREEWYLVSEDCDSGYKTGQTDIVYNAQTSELQYRGHGNTNTRTSQLWPSFQAVSNYLCLQQTLEEFCLVWENTLVTGFCRETPRGSEDLTSVGYFVSKAGITWWFCEVQVYLKEKKLKETVTDPSKIFNRDEMCFLICLYRKSSGNQRGQEIHYCILSW
jgi:hypothetical protein